MTLSPSDVKVVKECLAAIARDLRSTQYLLMCKPHMDKITVILDAQEAAQGVDCYYEHQAETIGGVRKTTKVKCLRTGDVFMRENAMSDEQKSAEEWLKQMHIWWDNAETFNRVTLEKTGRIAEGITGENLDAYYLDLIKRIQNAALERAAICVETHHTAPGINPPKWIIQEGNTPYNKVFAKAIRNLKEPT